MAYNQTLSLEAGQVVISINIYTNYGIFHTLVQFYNE